MIKKTIAIILAGAFMNFTPPYPPKELTVTLTLDQWQVALDCIDKSNAGHSQVKAIQELIVTQLQKQLADTTKPKK